MEGMSRREERERKHEQCLGRYKAAWMIVLFLLCLTGAYKYFEAQHKNEPDDFKLNLSTEILGVIASTGVTLFFLDKLNQRRDRENLKRRLIGEARSRSHDIAISAVEWMDREGWLRGEDGLLKGAEFAGGTAVGQREWTERTYKVTNLEGRKSEWRKFEGCQPLRDSLN